MKATFFYSHEQKQHLKAVARMRGKHYIHSYIDGNEYTELQTYNGEHKSPYDDAVIVIVKEGLPVNQKTVKLEGSYFADTSSLNITHL